MIEITWGNRVSSIIISLQLNKRPGTGEVVNLVSSRIIGCGEWVCWRIKTPRAHNRKRVNFISWLSFLFSPLEFRVLLRQSQLCNQFCFGFHWTYLRSISALSTSFEVLSSIYALKHSFKKTFILQVANKTFFLTFTKIWRLCRYTIAQKVQIQSLYIYVILHLEVSICIFTLEKMKGTG